jgi:hypothetical protein
VVIIKTLEAVQDHQERVVEVQDRQEEIMVVLEVLILIKAE